jgi:hypothetical protein
MYASRNAGSAESIARMSRDSLTLPPASRNRTTSLARGSDSHGSATALELALRSTPEDAHTLTPGNLTLSRDGGPRNRPEGAFPQSAATSRGSA